MSRRSIWLRLLAALAAGTLAAAGVGVGAWWSISPRATLTFAASKDFYPEEFSKDGSRLLGRIYLGPSATEPVAVWDVATGELLARFTDLPRWVTFTPDGQLAFVDGTGRLVLRDPATLSEAGHGHRRTSPRHAACILFGGQTPRYDGMEAERLRQVKFGCGTGPAGRAAFSSQTVK